LEAFKQTTRRFIAYTNRIPQATAPACWVSGIYHYELNQLDKARQAFEETVSLHYSTNFVAACDSWLALARICQVQRDFTQAQAHLDAVRAETLRLENRDLLPVIGAVQAYQWHLQGEAASALRWARNFDPNRSPEWIMLTFTPLLFWVRILAALGESAEQRILQKALESRIEHAKSRYFSRRTLQLLTHLALVQMKLGDGDQALRKLEKAIRLAQPGGFVRSFADLGPDLKPLLEQLRRQGVAPHYLDQLIVAFPQNGQTKTPLIAQSQEIATLLTQRETEILEMMQEGLNNNEIAQELVISLYTVKRHASNIYRKLEVRGRRQAVHKALQMGILALD
jgi:LuxR family maltose regulon positive regulatory protein